MRRLTLVAVTVIGSLLLASCGFRGSQVRAEQGVKEFHELLNREQYDVIYDRSDRSLKTSWTKAGFASYLRDVRSRLGRAGKAIPRGVQVKASTTRGIEVAMAMETRFERATVEERFLWRIEENRAILAGYQVDAGASPGPRTV